MKKIALILGRIVFFSWIIDMTIALFGGMAMLAVICCNIVYCMFTHQMDQSWLSVNSHAPWIVNAMLPIIPLGLRYWHARHVLLYRYVRTHTEIHR